MLRWVSLHPAYNDFTYWRTPAGFVDDDDDEIDDNEVSDARWAQRQYSTIWASLGPQTIRAPAADEKLGVVAETELEADVDFWSPGERGPMSMGMIKEDR